jgi:hypothetical protein
MYGIAPYGGAPYGGLPVYALQPGAAVAVVPVGRSVADPVLREALAETVMGDQSTAEVVTLIGFPLAVGGFFGFLIAAFTGPESAAIWAVAAVLITAILMHYADSREVLRRIANWLDPPE